MAMPRPRFAEEEKKEIVPLDDHKRLTRVNICFDADVMLYGRNEYAKLC